MRIAKWAKRGQGSGGVLKTYFTDFRKPSLAQEEPNSTSEST